VRNSELVRVPTSFGRDADKLFKITEMPASQSEKWALRLFIAMKGTSGEVPPEVMQMGMIAVAWRGLNTFLAADVDAEKLMPLLDDMMVCVEAVRDKSRPDVAMQLIEEDIWEPRTRVWLRGEIVRVHTGFSLADVLSSFLEASRAAASTSTSQTSQTSPA
jgi:hypothetical protein